MCITATYHSACSAMATSFTQRFFSLLLLMHRNHVREPIGLQAPLLAYNHFVEAVFVLNECRPGLPGNGSRGRPRLPDADRGRAGCTGRLQTHRPRPRHQSQARHNLQVITLFWSPRHLLMLAVSKTCQIWHLLLPCHEGQAISIVCIVGDASGHAWQGPCSEG